MTAVAARKAAPIVSSIAAIQAGSESATPLLRTTVAKTVTTATTPAIQPTMKIAPFELARGARSE